jgi:hypothetical protein
MESQGHFIIKQSINYGDNITKNNNRQMVIDIEDEALYTPRLRKL